MFNSFNVKSLQIPTKVTGSQHYTDTYFLPSWPRCAILFLFNSFRTQQHSLTGTTIQKTSPDLMFINVRWRNKKRPFSPLNWPDRTKAITQESGETERIAFDLIYTPTENDSEVLEKGKRVPPSIAGPMQVLMRMASGCSEPTTEPQGLEWKTGSRSSINRVAFCWPVRGWLTGKDSGIWWWENCSSPTAESQEGLQ